jgi:hypothetical protein
VTVGKHDGELTYCGLLPDRSGLTRVEHGGLRGLRPKQVAHSLGKEGRIRLIPVCGVSETIKLTRTLLREHLGG